MAIVISGKTPCAISGRIITGKSSVLCFPPFSTTPDDPVTICSDACVLRDEFEKWEYRDNVIELTKEFWIQQYHASETFIVVYEDDEYLFAKGKIEAKIRILLLKHAIVIDIPQAIWQNFRGQLLDMQDVVNISPYSTIALSFNKRMDKIEIRIDIQGNGWDCIELSLLEWSHFQSILTASGQFSAEVSWLPMPPPDRSQV